MLDSTAEAQTSSGCETNFPSVQSLKIDFEYIFFTLEILQKEYNFKKQLQIIIKKNWLPKQLEIRTFPHLADQNLLQSAQRTGVYQ